MTRTTCPVKLGRSLIEVAFDQGEIDTGQESAPLSEVELELKRGKAADLFQLAKTIAHKAPLELVLVSKAERGYRLAAGEESAPSKAVVVTLTPEMSSSQAFKAIALACLRQLTDNVPVLRQGDPEGLHQARVAVRRLRAAMSLFGELLRGDGSCAGEAVRLAPSGKSVRSTVPRLHVNAPSAVSAATSAWTQNY